MFGNGHQFNVCVTQFEHIFDDLLGQFSIIEIGSTIFGPFPRTEMQFVDGDGPLIAVFRGAVPQPVVVLPGETAEIIDERGTFRGMFRREGIRIGFLNDLPRGCPETEFIGAASTQVWDETPPDATVAGFQGIFAVSPPIGITDDRNVAGIGRPDREFGSCNSVDGIRMSAKMSIQCGIHTIGCRLEQAARKKSVARFGPPILVYAKEPSGAVPPIPAIVVHDADLSLHGDTLVVTDPSVSTATATDVLQLVQKIGNLEVRTLGSLRDAHSPGVRLDKLYGLCRLILWINTTTKRNRINRQSGRQCRDCGSLEFSARNYDQLRDVSRITTTEFVMTFGKKGPVTIKNVR